MGKSSISMGHLYHGYVSHNQRVRSKVPRMSRSFRGFPVMMARWLHSWRASQPRRWLDIGVMIPGTYQASEDSWTDDLARFCGDNSASYTSHVESLFINYIILDHNTHTQIYDDIIYIYIEREREMCIYHTIYLIHSFTIYCTRTFAAAGLLVLCRAGRL